jgi:Ca2+-binding RTX toxin-like protein
MTPIATHRIEPLEARVLLSSITHKKDHLVVRGDLGSSNDISVGLDAAKTHVLVNLNGAISSFNKDKVTLIDLIGGDSADFLHVDDTVTRFTIRVRLIGKGGDDTLVGGREKDEIWGDDGNDTIVTGNGDDTIVAGNGDDTVTAGNNLKLIFGGAGNDVITTGNGRGYVFGGDGNDTISTNGDQYELLGNAGSDTIHGRGRDTLWGGGGGTDQVSGGIERHTREIDRVTNLIKELLPQRPSSDPIIP